MTFVLKGKEDEPFEKPENVEAVIIDAYGGGSPVSGKPERSEYFIKGTQPSGPSPIYQKIKLSRKDNGKLASQWEIDNGEYDTKDYIVLKENDPISTDGKNRWMEGIVEWLKKTYAADRPEYYPPTETSNYSKEERNNEEPTPTLQQRLLPPQLLLVLNSGIKLVF